MVGVQNSAWGGERLETINDTVKHISLSNVPLREKITVYLRGAGMQLFVYGSRRVDFNHNL